MANDTRQGAPGNARATDPASSPFPSNLGAVLGAMGACVYDWDIPGDILDWGPSAAKVLRGLPMEAIATGRGFAGFACEAGAADRAAVLSSGETDPGHGVPFRIVHAVRPPCGPAFWIEDSGRWFAGPQGRPVRVHGLVRTIPAPPERDEPSAPLWRDPATGALGRSDFMLALDREIGRAASEHRSFVLLLADAAGEHGELLVRAAAARVRDLMRRGDLLGRLSPGSLGVALTGCRAAQLAEARRRVREAIQAVAPAAGLPRRAAFRVGAVVLPGAARTAEAALRKAEDTLAPRDGGRCTRAEEGASARSRRAGRADMRRFRDEVVSALNERRIVLVWQPVVTAIARRPAFGQAAAALAGAAFSGDLGEGVAPALERLAVAEFVDHRAAELALSALEEDPDLALTLAVSRSAIEGGGLLSFLGSALLHKPGIAGRLTVEIPEGAVHDGRGAVREFVEGLRRMGVGSGLRSLGSGRVSGSDLRGLRFCRARIDGALVQNIAWSSNDRFFVRNLIDLARGAGIQTVAEWVSDEETARQLEAWGVDFLQGPLFADAAFELRARAAPAPPLARSA